MEETVKEAEIASVVHWHKLLTKCQTPSKRRTDGWTKRRVSSSVRPSVS